MNPSGNPFSATSAGTIMPVMGGSIRAIIDTESLAMKLRLCVSSRTRPDTASMRDSVKPRDPWG